MVHELRSSQVAVEHLHAGDAHAVHPLYVRSDAFFCDVSIHPMPPNAWLGRVRRLLEVALQILSRAPRILSRGREAQTYQHHCESKEPNRVPKLTHSLCPVSGM